MMKEFFDMKTQAWGELGPLNIGRKDAVMAFIGGDLKIMVAPIEMIGQETTSI